MKHTYRLTRQYGIWPGGTEVELTDDEAIRINNEAPGSLERVEADVPKVATKPTVKADV